jgi:serine/threonine protein kinase
MPHARFQSLSLSAFSVAGFSAADPIEPMDEQDEALRARAEARLGSTLQGKYRLDRVLGIGGMATVFAATHRNQAELAVKVLHPELSLRDDLRKRFLREGYVGNSVKHPGAVLVVDDDIAEDGSAFLVMELLRGRSLEDLWEREGRHLSSRVVTALALQLIEVLDHPSRSQARKPLSQRGRHAQGPRLRHRASP